MAWTYLDQNYHDSYDSFDWLILYFVGLKLDSYVWKVSEDRKTRGLLSRLAVKRKCRSSCWLVLVVLRALEGNEGELGGPDDQGDAHRDRSLAGSGSRPGTHPQAKH